MDPDQELREFRNQCRLFPLPNVVLFPHAVVPLHIFEPRYKQMTEDALCDDKLVTIVQLRPGTDWHTVVDPEVESVACLGKILDFERLEDGRYNFLLVGLQRVRLLRELPQSKLYRQAEVDLLEDEYPSDAAILEAPRQQLVELFRALTERQNALDPEMARLLESNLDLGVLTDIIAHSLGLPPQVKQALLNEVRVQHRAQNLIGILKQIQGKDARSSTDPRSFPPPFSTN